MVVDLVQAHAQPGAVQGQHHLAEFAHAGEGVVGVGGVAAFGSVEVEGVVAPVEAVLRGHSHHGGLLQGAVGRGLGQLGFDTALFGNGGEVEHGEQVDVGHADAGQVAQVAHALAVALHESRVLAAPGWAHGGVVARKIAYVQFVHDHVVQALDFANPRRGGPARGLGARVAQVDDGGAARVGAERDGVGVGHALAHPALAIDPHFDQVIDELALQVGRLLPVPAATGGVPMGWEALAGCDLGAGVDAHLHRPGGGSPQAPFGGARSALDAQSQGLGRIGKQGVQRAGVLQPGGGQHAALLVFTHQKGLPLQQGEPGGAVQRGGELQGGSGAHPGEGRR